MKTKERQKKIGIRLYPDDIERLIKGLKVLCQDLAFYERRADENQTFAIAAERFNCGALKLILELKLNTKEKRKKR